MNISRPTFGRTLELAHRKVADTIINGKAIKIEGGTVQFEASNIEFRPGGFCVYPNADVKNLIKLIYLAGAKGVLDARQ